MYLSFGVEQRSSAHEKSILWLWFVVRGPLRYHSGRCDATTMTVWSSPLLFPDQQFVQSLLARSWSNISSVTESSLRCKSEIPRSLSLISHTRPFLSGPTCWLYFRCWPCGRSCAVRTMSTALRYVDRTQLVRTCPEGN